MADGGGVLSVGEGGYWVGVVDDQHRSENFEKILHFSSWQTERQTAAGGLWSDLQEVLESPGTNAGRTFVVSYSSLMSNSSTQPHPRCIRED